MIDLGLVDDGANIENNDEIEELASEYV